MQASAPTTHQSYFTKFSSTTPFDQIFWEKFYALPKHILFHQKKHHLITINLRYSMQGEHVFNQPQSLIVWLFFLCQKNILWSPLFENISCKTSCFLITRNHRLLIFGHWWKVFHAKRVVFQSPTIIDCVLFFLCEKKRPSFTTFGRYFTRCKSVKDHLLFVFFFSPFHLLLWLAQSSFKLKKWKNLCWYRVWSVNHDF